MIASSVITLILSVVAITLAPVSSHAQSQQQTVQPDLAKQSTDQLIACYENLKLCGANDIWQISDQLNSRLPSVPSERLVACFDDWRDCGAQEDQASGWPISDELARRGNIQWLLDRNWKTRNTMIRNGIEHVAYHFDTPVITIFMKKVVTKRIFDGEDRYWPINYLAKKCDAEALRELSSGRYRGQGSLQYQTSVELFGKCSYKPAIPYLVDDALYDFSLNVVIAAQDSLQQIYPDAPQDFDSLEKVQQYYCGRAKRDGFKVKCIDH